MSLTPADLRSAQKLVLMGFIVFAAGMLFVISGTSPGPGPVDTVLREKCAEKYRDAQTLADTLRADNFIPEPGLQGRNQQHCSFFRPLLRHRDGFRSSAPSRGTSFLVSAQQSDTLHLRVGSPEIQATGLKPFTVRFTGHEVDCDDSSDVPEDEIDRLDLVRTSRGSNWRYITRSRFSNRNTVIDTSLFDRQTLAPLRTRTHSLSAAGYSGFDVTGSRVSWIDVNPGDSQRLDTTLAAPAFVGGIDDLLVPILASVLVGGRVVDWPMVGIDQSESDPRPRLVVGRTTARRAERSLPRPDGVPEGSIPIDFGDGVYSWLSAIGHEEIARQFPAGEAQCASLYLRSAFVQQLSPKADSNSGH
jgi:hypothetical protein